MNVPVPRIARLPRLWLLAAAFGCVLIGVIGAALWQLRQGALDGQARELAVLSLALTDEVERGLLGVEEGLRQLRDELRRQRANRNDADAERLMRGRAELLPLVQAYLRVGPDGSIVAGGVPPPALDAASFAPPLAALGLDEVAISRTFTDGASPQSFVALAVRVGPSADDGWVAATLPADALLGAFSAATPAPDARMAAIRVDGARLAGAIVATPALDEATLARRLETLRRAQVGRFSDGQERLVDMRTLPRFGVKLVLSRDIDAVLAAWRQTAWMSASGLALLLAVLGLSVQRVQRAERQRAAAQLTLQEQIARSTRMESLGTLAGGIAHDFNNVLAAAQGYGELAREAAPADSAQARQLDRLLQATARGRALVQRILAFSRSGNAASIVFEIQPVVAEALDLLEPTFGQATVVMREIDAGGARVRGDPTLVVQAVSNLCTNAAQAMPAGGTLRVALRAERVAAARVLSHGRLAPGDHVVLTVADEGIGMPPEVLARVFEPFFTTRRERSGTGLGLAIVQAIVADLGGAIDLRSAPQRGTTFTLWLPACDAPAHPQTAVEPVLPRGAGQTIMVVDDEPGLVELAEEVLADLGYEPVGYSDPMAALAALRAQPGRFDAVITDEIMPGVTGTQLTEALRVHAPDMPVLLVSGYGGADLAARAASAGVTRVAAKPLQRVALAHALDALLRRAPG